MGTSWKEAHAENQWKLGLLAERITWHYDLESVGTTWPTARFRAKR